MTIKTFFILSVLSLSLIACKSEREEEVTPAESESLAFPEADGGGKNTTGGRNGVIYYVTSLVDDAEEAGTLRYALKQTTTRIILFKVSGRINLKSELRIKKGNVTIAGQSAPGDGICISGYPVIVEANNVIIRFLRFRMGDTYKVEGDALSVNNCDNVIIDHCSFSWSTDECVSCYGNTNFTLQYCFITESLRNSVHVKNEHGYGGIWGGENASFHHNLLAHHDSRNPRFDHDYVDAKYAGPIDYVNNVVYNWGGNSTYGGEGTTKGAGGRHINFINNYYKYGPATSKKTRLVDPTVSCSYCVSSPGGTVEGPKIYLSGNYMYGSTEVTYDNWKGSTQTGSNVKATSPWTEGLTSLAKEQSAANAFETVLAKAGCSLKRDAIDARIAEEVQSGTVTYKTGSGGSKNGLIDSQSDVGGWPVYNSDAYPQDSDGDGIPDEWEQKNGLNPNSYSDGKAVSIMPPYTNIEVYLNSLVGHLY